MEVVGKFSCVIIDDDKNSGALLKSYLKGIDAIELKEIFVNPELGLNYLAQNNTDILFLDMKMPKLSGINLVKSLAYLPYIIVTTSRPEFAAESYALDIADYLLKPISVDRFTKAVQKALEYLNTHNTAETQPNVTAGNDFAYIRIENKYIKINYSDIIYVEADDDYTKVYTLNQIFVTSINLKAMEESLPFNQFIRTHRSFLINVDHILSIELDQVNMLKYNVPLGNTYKAKLHEKTIGRNLIK